MFLLNLFIKCEMSLRLYRNKQNIVGAVVLDRPETQRVASPDRRQSACGRGRDPEDNPRGGDVVPYKILVSLQL